MLAAVVRRARGRRSRVRVQPRSNYPAPEAGAVAVVGRALRPSESPVAPLGEVNCAMRGGRAHSRPVAAVRGPVPRHRLFNLHRIGGDTFGVVS